MQWNLKEINEPERVSHLIQVLNVSPLIAQLLVLRGVHTFDQARDFFRPELKNLHNPFLMKDMNKAVHRILKALSEKEKIMVFGDYDVDGTTAVSLVYSYLKNFSSKISTYIPDRYNEGYGISYQGIDFAHQNNIKLIIALDCGIKSFDHVKYASKKGIDFIICDHHLPEDNVPEALAVLDAKQKNCSYPFKELCGCGVGFKLIQALHQQQNLDFKELENYLDLVAVAIAADLVPINGENRVLAHYGLKILNQRNRPGLKALMSDYQITDFTITDVVFKIAPKINAAGRIEHGIKAVELLTEYNTEQAVAFAQRIVEFNSHRKQLDSEITQQALEQIRTNQEENNFTTVVYDASWHKGVIGIVASRLIENFYRPTIVFTQSGDKLAASARSVAGFDVYQALEACSEYLIQFGGHMYAAGMTLYEKDYPKFKARFEEIVQQTITKDCLEEKISIDAQIHLSDLDAKTLRILKQMEPHGPENMHPVFATKNLYDTGYAQSLGQANEHLKLFVKEHFSPVDSKGYSAIAFKKGYLLNSIQGRTPFSLAYTLSENHWKDKTTLQLQIKDIQIAKTAEILD